MTQVTVNIQQSNAVVTEENSIIAVTPLLAPSVVLSAEGPQGATGPQRDNDIGVIYLKNNAIPTPIASPNTRAVASGVYATGELYNFTKDIGSNSLKYNGDGGKFLMIATFNFYSGSQDVCGFYLGVSTNPALPLDPNADRISESEIYANAGTPSNQPQTLAIQTVRQLNNGDRVFFIAQNRSAANNITVEFLKLVAWQ